MPDKDTSPSGTGQLGKFVARVSKLFGVGENKSGAAEVPFKTAFILTKAQEGALVEHALLRMGELYTELGLSAATGLDSETGLAKVGATWTRSWMAKREIFDLIYHNRVEWRKWCLGGIFNSSNLVVPLARRVVRQMVARAVDYFFATDPWFAAYPQTKEEDGLAEKIERFTRYKAERAKLKQTITNAFEMAFVRGESVIKTRHVTKEQIYRSFKNVMVDGDGKVILSATGDFIFDDDAWVPQMQAFVPPANPADLGAAPLDTSGGQATLPQAQPPAAAPAVAASPDAGQPAQAAQAAPSQQPSPQPAPQLVPTGKLVLKKDGMTVKPDVAVFVNKLVTRKLTMSHGPEAAIVYFKDFLCPLTADNVQDADIVIHLYDMPAMDIADTYRRHNAIQSPDESLDDLRSVTKALDGMMGATEIPKSWRDQPRMEEGELLNTSGDQNPTSPMAECWMRFDADGDGIMEELMVLIDVQSRRAIFYDYLANITPDGKRPFDPIRINFIDGRWHGYGAMEMFHSSQEFVDLLINRVNFSQSAAGRVTFWNPALTREGQNNPNLELNTGKTYTPIEGKTGADALSYVTLPEVKGPDLMKLVEFFTQIVQLESGVIHAGDQGFSDMDAGKLATGIRNIERSGQEMFGLYLGQLEDGVEPIMDKMMLLTLANMDDREVFEYFEGDSKMLFDEITKEEVQNITLKVKLLLTRYRGEQQLQSNTQAVAVINQFYALPLGIQTIVADMFTQMLKALQVQKAEDYIKPGLFQIPAQGGPQPNAQAGVAAINAKPPGQATANL